jgi:hypothetical protein
MSLLNRREFLSATALAGAAAPLLARPAQSESVVAHLYSSLSEEQKRRLVFPFDHPLRSKVDNNWHITDERVGRIFNSDQLALVRDIYRGLHSAEFADRALKRLDDDAGGIGNYSVALFGEPGTGAFELVFTGRHCTVRCDGDSVEGAAFGGPIFYGHQGLTFNEAAHHPNNIYWFQAKKANQVFQALDGKQRAAALLGSARPERGPQTVALKDHPEGLPVADMSADQRALVEQTLADLLLPFRDKDRAESMALIKATGGVESLSMAFYKNHDIGNDGVWDVWQLESPTMVWHFRGAPHIHVWVNIQKKPGWAPPA